MNAPVPDLLSVERYRVTRARSAALVNRAFFFASPAEQAHDDRARSLMGREHVLPSILAPGCLLLPGAFFAGSQPARSSGKCRKSDLYLCSSNRACLSGELLTCVSTLAPGSFRPLRNGRLSFALLDHP
jgi:hypothetical protein